MNTVSDGTADGARRPDDGKPEVPVEAPAREARRVSQEPGGPMLIEGPVEFVREDGGIVRSDRPVVALCTCRRSRRYPFCDTSHRRRPRRDR